MLALSALAMLLVSVFTPASPATAQEAEAEDRPVAHIVIFTLKDQSRPAVDAFVKSCHTLSSIDGVTHFSVGVRAEDLDEGAVSVKDFDVALHTVFKNKQAKQAYLVHPTHKKFVQDNGAQFAKVRVFDSYLTRP
jgi:hypothetical protein